MSYTGQEVAQTLVCDLIFETRNHRLKSVPHVLVDPTGLKPALRGLKGRRSVTRAPGQEHFRFPIFDWRLDSRVRKINFIKSANRESPIANRQCLGCGGRIRTFDSRINNPVPYHPLPQVVLTFLVELRGVEPPRPACKAGIIPLDHSPENWSRRRESNPHPFVYETNALPHELLRKELMMEARGGVEPRAFPPSSCRFGLEDRCRERGPFSLPIFDWRLPIDLVNQQH